MTEKPNMKGAWLPIFDRQRSLTRVYWDKHFEAGEESSEYLWSEGNYGCDCNRGLFFASVGDEPDPNTPCNDGEFRYHVGYAYLQSGEVVEIDGDLDDYPQCEDCPARKAK